MINIKQYFRNLVDISDKDLDLFITKLHKTSFRKKSIILEIGNQENFLSFVEQGILRFNIPQLDYDFTFGFAFPDSFVSGYDSLYQGSFPITISKLLRTVCFGEFRTMI